MNESTSNKNESISFQNFLRVDDFNPIFNFFHVDDFDQYSISSIGEDLEGVPNSLQPADESVSFIRIDVVPNVFVCLEHWMILHQLENATSGCNRLKFKSSIRFM